MRLSALVTIAMLFVSPLSVQRGDGQARVEVASIKAAKRPDDPRGLTCALPYVERTGGRIYILFSQVCGLLRVAYDLSDYQVVGIPRDTGVGPSNFFEVDVRLAGGDAPSREETRVVLRELLAERFKLRAHHESREMPIYALVTTTNGESCSFSQAKQLGRFSTRLGWQRRRSSFAGYRPTLSRRRIRRQDCLRPSKSNWDSSSNRKGVPSTP